MMLKLNYFFLVLILVSIIIIPIRGILHTQEGPYYLISVIVKAPPDKKLPKDLPIILKLKDIVATLPDTVDPFSSITPNSEDDVNWYSVAVLFGEHVIPSQIDDLDGNDFSQDDELVFLLIDEIPPNTYQEYKVFVPLMASKLPKIVFPIRVRVREYRHLASIVKNSPDLMQEAYDVSNNVVTFTVAVKAAWMSGSIFSAMINKTGFDVIKQGSKFMGLLWKWSRFFCPADPGWIENNPNAMQGEGELLFLKEGPVRAVVKLKLKSSYHNITGVHAVFTYTLYVNHTWIYATLDITGPEAKPGMFLEVNLANRDWSGIGKGGIYKTVMISTAGNFSRTDDIKVPISKIKEGWYLALDEKNEKGFGFLYPLIGLDWIGWSFDDEGIHNYYLTMNFPYNSVIIIFDKTITENPIDYVKYVYNNFYLVKPIMVLRPAELISELPGELKKMKQIFELQEKIISLEKDIETLSKKIAELRSLREILEIVVYRTYILLTILVLIAILLGYVAGRGHAYRKLRRCIRK